MHSIKYIKDIIIKSIDTQKSRMEGTSGKKNFYLSQRDIDEFGLKTIIATVLYLEQNLPAGAVTINWDRGGYGRDIKSFSVRKEAIDDLFDIIGEESPRKKLDEAVGKILRLQAKTSVEWLKTGYYEDLKAKVGRGTLPVIDEDFDRVLNAVCSNTKAVYMRVFSVNVTGNSKKLGDEYQDKICRIIRKYCPVDFEGYSDNDVFRYFNIMSYNTILEFKGSIVWALKTSPYVKFSTAGQYFGTMINTDTILNMQVKDLPSVKEIITIENRANFYAMTYRPDTLYIYVHGFLSPSEANICRQINRIADDNGVSIRHWGDLDYGGMQIFQYLKTRVFPSIRPLHMDKSAYEEYDRRGVAGYQIPKSTMEKLQNINIPELNELRDVLIEKKIGFEQESIIDW